MQDFSVIIYSISNIIYASRKSHHDLAVLYFYNCYSELITNSLIFRINGISPDYLIRFKTNKSNKQIINIKQTKYVDLTFHETCLFCEKLAIK